MLQMLDQTTVRAATALAPLPRNPQARTLLAQAQAALDDNPTMARLMLDQLSIVLNAPVAEEITSFAPAAVRRGGLAAWQLRQVKTYIEENLGSTLHVGTLAGLAKLSTSHFCRAFKISTEETAHTFIMRRRLALAKTLMVNSGDSLCQIAAACGLADQAHLTRLFRRFTGETPFAWRRAYHTPASAVMSREALS